MKFIILLLLTFSLFSCGKVPNESWVLDNMGSCSEIPYSYSRITFYHLGGINSECQLIWGRNIAGFIYDEYMECDFGPDGTWRYFRTEEECCSFI